MPDNLNTSYLTQPTTSTNINSAYLGGSDSAATETEENPQIFASRVSLAAATSVDAAFDADTVSVAGGTAMNVLSSITQAVVAITVETQDSNTTTFTLSGATTTGPQMVLVGAPSSLSDGLTYAAYASDANEGTLLLSNVSTSDLAQTAQTWRFTLVDFA